MIFGNMRGPPYPSNPFFIGSARWTGEAPTYPLCMVGSDDFADYSDFIVMPTCDENDAVVCLVYTGTGSAEDVQLGMGDFAFVPVRPLSRQPQRPGHVSANGIAAVRAHPGPWDGPEQLVLISNLDQCSVTVCVGDVAHKDSCLLSPPISPGRLSIGRY